MYTVGITINAKQQYKDGEHMHEKEKERSKTHLQQRGFKRWHFTIDSTI